MYIYIYIYKYVSIVFIEMNRFESLNSTCCWRGRTPPRAPDSPSVVSDPLFVHSNWGNVD